MPRTQRPDAALSRAIKGSLRAYSSGNAKFFAYFAPDARIFTLENTTKPIVGRAAFQKEFGGSLRAIKRRVSVLDSDLRLADDQAIQSQTLQITSKGVTSHVRQSVVWTKDAAGAWHIIHVHNSLVGQPVIAPNALNVGDPVRVVNERIATVSAAVGVAQ